MRAWKILSTGICNSGKWILSTVDPKKLGLERGVEGQFLTDQELEDIKLAAINEYLSALPEEQKPMIDRVSYYRGREDGKANAEIEKEQVAREAFIEGFNSSAEGWNGEYGCRAHELEEAFNDYWKEKNK